MTAVTPAAQPAATTRPAWTPGHVVRRGAGEPTVLLHGIGSRGEAWEPVLDGLAARRDVVVLDLPGFGRSPLGTTRPTVAGYADHVQRVCATLGLDRPHVAGSSLGGAVALELGRRGAARSVVAFAPVGFWGLPGVTWCQGTLRAMRTAASFARPALPLLVRSAAARSALFSLFYAAPQRVPPAVLVADSDAFSTCEGFDRTLGAFVDHVFTDPGRLPELPVTVVWGARDRLLPAATQARRARLALPSADHVVLPGCGHVPFPDDPVACLMLLLHEWHQSPRRTP
jgi:pimeloyl-ACP methyl ester carboxylesterase